MNNTTAYTPLESLFLFQLLSQYGFADDSFNRISEELKRNPILREQESYEAGRLSPDALKELSLQLLREEQRHEAEATDANGANGTLTSRKRKIPSPPIPSIKEAQEHSDKLPLLVDRLYALYKDTIIRQVREDERRIEILQREIKELERAERVGIDVARQERGAASTAGNVTVEDLKAAKPVRLNGQVVQTPIPVPSPSVQNTPKSTPGTLAPLPAAATAHQAPTALPSPSTRPPVIRSSSEVPLSTPSGISQDLAKPANGPSSVLQRPQAAQAYSGPPSSVTPQPTVSEGMKY
jgi:hypothetical protein